MATYQISVTWDTKINNLYKDITLIQQGISAKLNISLRNVSRITVNYKVGNEYFTDLADIDLENNKVIVPFKREVLQVGTQQLELVCHMKNGDVLPTPTYSYTVTRSLSNEGGIPGDEETLSVLRELINSITENEAIVEAAEAERQAAELHRANAEDERTNAEAERKANENTRISNEDIRQLNETNRESNENSREQYETTRRTNESNRINNEATRENAELLRLAQENERLSKEIERQNNESIRQEFYNGFDSKLNEVSSQLEHITKQIYPTMTREEIQEILNDGGNIMFTSGVYTFEYNIVSELTNANGYRDTAIYLDVKSNSNIYFDKDVIINIEPCELDWYRIFRVFNCENVTINGGIIVGDRINHVQQMNEGQWGHGIYIALSNNIQLKNMTIENCYGDGICVGRSSNITISNCTSNNNRRQALTIGNGECIFVEKCNFLNTNGQAPQAGIDIEPDLPSNLVRNIIIKDCLIEGNEGSGIEVNLSKLNTETEMNVENVESVSISIDNCIIKNNHDGLGYFYLPDGKELINSVKGFVKITNSHILLNNRAGILMLNIKEHDMPTLIGDNLNISNWRSFGIGSQVFSINDNASDDNIVEYGGCYFNNITFSELPNTSDYDCPIYIQNYTGRKFNGIFNNIYIVDDVPKNRWCSWREGEGYVKYINKDVDFVLPNSSVSMGRLNGLRCIVNGDFAYQLLDPKLLKGKEYTFVNGGNNNSFCLKLSEGTSFDSQFVEGLDLYITDKGSEICIKSDGSNTWRTEKVYGNVSPSEFIYKRKVFYGGKAPTQGTWTKGDMILNANPSSATSGVEYWVCVESGSPGNWEIKLKQ